MQKNTNNSLPVSMAIIPLAAEPVGSVGNFVISNTMVNAWLVTIFFLIIAFIVSKRQSVVPKGIQNVIEAVIETMSNQVEKVVGDRKRARQFFPLVATIFLVVLANNWFGLVPGTGTFGFYELLDGRVQLVPLLRSAASDLNFTLALAITAVVFSHLVGIKAVGVFNYFSKFFNFKGIWQSLSKGPMAIMTVADNKFTLTTTNWNQGVNRFNTGMHWYTNRLASHHTWRHFLYWHHHLL